MTKKELIEIIASEAGITKKRAGSVLSSILGAIRSSERTEIRGFGVFRYKTRAAKIGRNISTGAAIQIPEKTVLTFRAAK